MIKKLCARVLFLGCIIALFLTLSGFVCSETNEIELDSLSGEYVQTSKFKGKVVVISWWATWCKPCLQELKFLNRLVKKYSDDLVVVAISTDGPETRSIINQTVRAKRLDRLVVLIDPDGSTNSLGTLPYSIYINREGLRCSEQSGFNSGDEIIIEKKIKDLIERK